MKTFKQFLTEEDDMSDMFDMITDALDPTNKYVYYRMEYSDDGSEGAYFLEDGIWKDFLNVETPPRLPQWATFVMPGLWYDQDDEPVDDVKYIILQFYFTDKKLATEWKEYVDPMIKNKTTGPRTYNVQKVLNKLHSMGVVNF